MKQIRKFFVYSIPPIDLWHPLQTLEVYLAGMYKHGDNDGADALFAFVASAKQAVVDSGFALDGGIAEGPYVVYLPFDFSAEPGAVAWKHGTAGECFVVSLVPMPQLDAVALG